MIRFGMALMEMVEQLTKGFIKVTGRQPDNLEKLKIQQEAVQRFKDMNKVVDMQGNPIDVSKGIMGGKQIEDDLPPPGSRGGKDDIAAPMQSAEQSIEDVLDAAIDNVSPGFANDLKVDATLVAGDVAEKLGLKYQTFKTVENAYKKAISDSNKVDTIMVTGSNYLFSQINDLNN